MRRRDVLIGIGSAALAGPTSTRAQSWPTKPVKIVAPFAAGGAADTLGRIIAEPLSNVLHQQFYVENRGGAGALIGAQTVPQRQPMAPHSSCPASRRM
jgi:tripartite-type tricarboxylate transporter receptor subunit TctC